MNIVVISVLALELITAFIFYFFIWTYMNNKPIETLLDLLFKDLMIG